MVNWVLDKIKEKMSFIKRRGSLQRRSRSPLKPIYQLDTSMLTLPPVGVWKSTTFDWRNRADVAIIIAATVVAAVVSDTVITSGAIIIIGSIIGVLAVVSVVVFIRWPGAQETPCRRVLLGRLIVVLFRGGVVPFPGHIVVVIFIFQFPVGEELEVLAVGQGLVVLWPGLEVPLFCVPVQRSAGLIGGLGVELRGHLPDGLGFSGGVGGIRGWGGHGKRRVSEMVQLLSAWGRSWMHGALMRD
jgi:hypothetical protein